MAAKYTRTTNMRGAAERGRISLELRSQYVGENVERERRVFVTHPIAQAALRRVAKAVHVDMMIFRRRTVNG